MQIKADEGRPETRPHAGGLPGLLLCKLIKPKSEFVQQQFSLLALASQPSHIYILVLPACTEPEP